MSITFHLSSLEIYFVAFKNVYVPLYMCKDSVLSSYPVSPAFFPSMLWVLDMELRLPGWWQVSLPMVPSHLATYR